MSCPDRGELLDLVLAGEDVPHLRECDDCADYVEGFWLMREVCKGRPENFQLALEEFVDEELEGVPSKDWAAVLVANGELHHPLIIRELLRRAQRVQENPSVEVNLTSAAVALCDASMKAGAQPSAQLRFDVFKEHAMALRAANDLAGALDALVRASAVASELENREQLDAIVALCTALTYTEADLGKFDEAIALAERAEGVLELCGDRRRALMARQTKAHALACMSRFAEALAIALPLAGEYDAMGSPFDAANAHNLIAHCYAEIGTYDEALGHALVAQCGYEKVGNAIAVARASHTAACAQAGLGHFDEAQPVFDQTADIVFRARDLDVWVLMRLDYIAAALHHDPAADVRADAEGVAMVCLTLGDGDSTLRRRYAAEALDYLRRLARRDALTVEATHYVRHFVALNARRPPVRFTVPSLDNFVM